MRFVFSRRFYLLFLFALVPISLSWSYPVLRQIALAYDLLLVAAGLIDYLISRKLPEGFAVTREFQGRFAIGEPNEIRILIENDSITEITARLKDEYPPAMTLTGSREAELTLGARTAATFTYKLTPVRRGKYQFGKTAVRYLSRLGLVWCQTDLGEAQTVKVYPNFRRAREMELKALGAQSFLSIQRRAVRRGEGREFESMRDYVRGDELRHISWTATARRSKLTTRQYQIERDQTVIIAIDAGRMMTGRIDGETKFDTAIHAALALMSACTRAGDSSGIVVFGRGIRTHLPPQRGAQQFDAVLEALHDLEPESIEPSYARAFQFIAANLKKRAFVVILTDVVDKDSSRDLIRSLKLLRPRHLPLVATIGDRDLNAMVSSQPDDIREVFRQSAAEEIIHQRETALRMVETLGGLALDVTTQNLAPKLLESYIRVKERGLL